MYTKRVILIGAIVLMQGCSTTGQKYKALDTLVEGHANVYIYLGCDQNNKDYLPGGTTGMSLYLNKKFVGYVSDGTYVPLVLPFGEHDFEFTGTWNWKAADVEFSYNIDSMETKYFERIFKADEYESNKYWYEAYERDDEHAIQDLQYCLLQEETYQSAIKNGLSR